MLISSTYVLIYNSSFFYINFKLIVLINYRFKNNLDSDRATQ